MKKILTVSVLLSLFVAVVWAATAAPDFSGTWVLDKAKSESLPPQMSNADISWVISVADKAFKKEVKGGATPQTENYHLDGKEVAEDVTMRQMPMKAKRTAKAMGEMIELKSVLSGEFNGNPVTITITQHLELAEGGKLLKVHQVTENPRGPQEAKYVFTKK